MEVQVQDTMPHGMSLNPFSSRFTMTELAVRLHLDSLHLHLQAPGLQAMLLHLLTAVVKVEERQRGAVAAAVKVEERQLGAVAAASASASKEGTAAEVAGAADGDVFAASLSADCCSLWILSMQQTDGDWCFAAFVVLGVGIGVGYCDE